MTLRTIISGIILSLATCEIHSIDYSPTSVSATIALKTPGNDAIAYPLTLHPMRQNCFDYQLSAKSKIPLMIYQKVTDCGKDKQITLFIIALEDIYFHYSQQIQTGSAHNNCLFYMPGFWYRRNMRSPKESPSFHTSDSWVVREDRLSTPMTTVYDQIQKKSYSIVRIDSFNYDALSTHKDGEVILSGKTSIGFTGFKNSNGIAALSFGFPYEEAPKTYIRKITLAPAVEAFQLLEKGKSLELTWKLHETNPTDFSDCVKQAWEYSFDLYQPQPISTPYTIKRMKEVLSNFFVESFVGNTPTKYYAGVELRTADCNKQGTAEVGFVGRTLLNAFNALEYGDNTNRKELANNARDIFDSYLKHGFTDAGFFHELIHYDKNQIESIHSIRRQSEGVYAILYYLDYQRRIGKRHPEWEKRISAILENFIRLQNNDGSFPRKFRDDFTIVDKSGGSTPSATLPLVMGYKYFKNKRFLQAAKKSVEYLEKELISKADYFSSTLDANCEDKEASLYAATAAYYLALVSNGKERSHYANLVRKAAYFALSWYYTWDVPFAHGQMLGDIGLKTKGWGNVSVENNHIDAFVFDFADVLNWLSNEYHEPRFRHFSEVISTSMRQLLPYEGHLCGIAKKGYYPEVVQHTNWDYGKNGKGFYNDIFAPGWVVASLWELLTPGRAEAFLCK